jgi:Domain of unknown function (DUF5069)
MDLTKTYPRSVHQKLAGIVQIGRTADKARAYKAGTVGEYDYNCVMDRAVFGFLGIHDHEAFAETASRLDDAALETLLRERYLSKKTPAEIERWNAQWVTHGPEAGTDAYDFFIELRTKVAPHRSDVTSWADLLDLDEGRDVPRKAAA